MRVFNIILLFLSFFYLSNAQIILANETAVSGDDWLAGDGFNQWSFSNGASAGNYVGNPNDVGVSTTNIGDVSFALYATGNEYANAYLQLDQPMQVGEKLTFYWAINWDANGGAKGFDFQHSSTSSATSFFSVSNTNSSTITAGGLDADTGYGVTPMLVTLDRTSATEYQFTMTSRSGGSDYTYTINQSNALDQIKFFCGNQNDGSGKRNMFFNKFKIQSNTSSVTISSDRTLDNLEVLSNTTLTIDPAASITIAGNFTNNGTFTLDSDSDEFSSIIIDGTPSGNITYNRWVNSVDNGTPGWDLVGSPASGVTISSIIGDSDLATNGSSPTTYALGSFSNTDLSWSNVDSNDDTSGTLTSGQGYQMATTSGGTITFNGSVLTTTQTVSITNNNPNDNGDSNLAGSRWNLIANPFPSYINANTSADSNHNFLSDNLGGSINNNYTALYAYDANGGYTPINNTSSATYIAPGQGFFVASVVGGGTITFDANTRTTTGGDDFVANRMANTSQEFYLRLYEDDNLIEDNKFYFDNGLTLGLDPGYDAGAFDQNMDIMSRLSENDQGVGFSINAMGLNSLETNTVIPLVFNRSAGVEFSVSFEDASIPEGVGIYLQDTLLETLTDLRAEDFTLTPDSDLSDMGRFYVVIGNTSLGGNDLEASYISIYKAASENHITIEGLLNVEKANVQLFNIIGQEVLNTTLQSNQSIQSISTAGLTTGVYIVRLEADNSIVTKKVIIN
jgi:hypothetical protein